MPWNLCQSLSPSTSGSWDSSRIQYTVMCLFKCLFKEMCCVFYWKTKRYRLILIGQAVMSDNWQMCFVSNYGTIKWSVSMLKITDFLQTSRGCRNTFLCIFLYCTCSYCSLYTDPTVWKNMFLWLPLVDNINITAFHCHWYKWVILLIQCHKKDYRAHVSALFVVSLFQEIYIYN